MTPNRLLDHFDRIADAPDAIPRLRRFILDLAVRGKLVEQDPNDEPASALLKRIHAEKVQMIREGNTTKEPKFPAIDENEAPFDLPPGWTWARFPEVGIFGRGKSKHRPRNDASLFEGGTHLFVQTGDVARSNGVIETYTSKYNDIGLAQSAKWPTGTLCITIAANIADSGILSFDACFPDSVVGFIPASLFPSARYFEYFIRTAKADLLEFAPATAQKNINLGILNAVLIPLPPLAEQHRIVAKVDELMALCDRLEAAQAERESRRDKLAAASLHRLNNGADADEFREHARFHLRHLPHLTTRPEHIQRLRQTILNLAVRGKLVPQDPNDEPASELLKRTQKEKEQLANEGKIKKHEMKPPVADTEVPFPVPQKWSWGRIEDIFTSITDGDHLPPPKTEAGIPFLVIGNVRNQSINFSGCRHVAEDYYNALHGIRRPTIGDVLYTLVGSYGIPVMVRDDRPFCVQRHIGVLRPSKHIDTSFVVRTLESRLVLDQATSCATGIAQKTVPLSGLRRILIPLPPVAEQHRIVAKVDELMALCDRLEAQLTTTQAESRRLVDVVLNESLEGIG